VVFPYLNNSGKEFIMPVVSIKELKTHLPPKSRVLGVDHGMKTLGLALSNPDLTIATPLKTLARTKFTENVRQLADICREYDVRGFVIGLPYNMDGSEGPRAESVRHFGKNLMEARATLGFDPLIAFWDERLSTFEAEQFLIDEVNMSRRRRDKIIDKMAAQNILQGALDSFLLP
jgi:putative Holliday junction resolvase